MQRELYSLAATCRRPRSDLRRELRRPGIKHAFSANRPCADKANSMKSTFRIAVQHRRVIINRSIAGGETEVLPSNPNDVFLNFFCMPD
jgi:hypothetical protein